MKKLNFKLFLTLNLLFLFFGCSSSDDLQVNYVYQYEKILFAKGSNGMNNREEINQDLLNFKVKITSSIELSDKLTFDELGVLIKDSKANIEVEYFINDESIIATSIKEGADLNSLAVSSRICGNCVRDQNGNILDSFSHVINIMMNNNHYVAIMAGGIGSRFWPMSRTSYPKQFLDILNTGRTLIQATHDRFKKFIPVENIYIVTSEEYVEIVRDQLPEIPAKNIVAEPSRKNTAPCIAYISYKLQQLNDKGTLICAPADHIILDDTAFTKVCLEATGFVKAHKALITMGIKPSHPNTGYGYIQFEQQPASDNVYKVKTFTEKPNLELAKAFLASGDFLWNAGIFVWSAKSILKAFETHLPEMYALFSNGENNYNTALENQFIETNYAFSENISIDFGIMEKAINVFVLPVNFKWNDLGTWSSLYNELKKDSDQNATLGGEVIYIDSSNNIVKTQSKKRVVIQGLNDYIVVEKDDVILICPKDKEQDIKQITSAVKNKFGKDFV